MAKLQLFRSNFAVQLLPFCPLLLKMKSYNQHPYFVENFCHNSVLHIQNGLPLHRVKDNLCPKRMNSLL